MSDANGSSSRNSNQRRGGSGGGKNSGRGGGGRRGGARGGSGQNNRGKENEAPVRQRYESEMSEGDGDRCTVCLYQIEIYAVGECDHFVCHRCATRMRVLCLRNECAICRRDLPKIILMRENKKYELMKNEILPMDQKFKICFETEQIEDEYARLLGNECNMCEEKQIFRNFLQLKKHMNMEHKRFYCDLCVDNLKIFSFERKHYDKQGLTDHRTKGDKEDTSFKGHPLCEYCGIRFLDNDELFKHLRKDHYFCHFCDADGNQYFFSEYKDLRQHFKKDHYLCEDPECEEQKFVVFRSELDFKAHKLEKHSDTKSAFKQNRRVDLEFSFNRREGREERGGGGGFSSRDVREERTRRYDEEREPSPAVQVQETVPDLVADFPSLGASQPRPVTVMAAGAKGQGSQAKKLAKSTGQNVSSGGASWSGMSGGAPASMEEYPSLPGARAAAAASVPVHVQSYRPQIKKNKQESVKSNSGGSTEQFPGLPGFSAPPVNVPVQSYRPQVKKNKQESAKSNSGGGAKLGGGDQFPGLPAPTKSKKPVSNIRGATASGPSYRPSTAPPNTLNTRTHRAPSKPSSQPTTKTQNTKQRYFDPFDDDSDDDFSYGGDTPAGLDYSSSKAIKASGQGMDYTSKESSSNIKSIDKSVLEALKGARISERSVPAPIKPVLVSSKQEFPGLGAPGGGSSDKKGKKGKQGKGKGGLDFSNILGGVETQKSGKPKSTKPAASSKPTPAPASPAKINWFAESLTVRSSKQKPSSNNQKQEKAVTIPTSDDFPSFDLKSRGPGHAFLRADEELIQPSQASNKSQWNKKGERIQQKEPNGSGGHWSDGSQGASPTRNLSPEKQRPNQNKNYVFDPPADFQERNTALISTVSEVLGNKSLEFKQFREMSVKFRSGGLSCKQYFKTCSELMDNTTFVSIFSELMVLLPDINKQQELYTEFMIKYPEERNKVCSCDICRQVLLSDDFDEHRSSHHNEQEFPVLG